MALATLVAPMTNTIEVSPVRFLKFCVTNGTTKARVHYGVDNRADGRKCVTIYAQDYSKKLGAIMPDLYENKTDSQTDYFDEGMAEIPHGHPLYEAARARAEAVIAERAAKWEAKQARRMARAN